MTEEMKNEEEVKKEWAAIQAVYEALKEFDMKARRRIMGWVNSKIRSERGND